MKIMDDELKLFLEAKMIYKSIIARIKSGILPQPPPFSTGNLDEDGKIRIRGKLITEKKENENGRDPKNEG